MNPEEASRLYHYFVSRVKDGYEEDRVKDGKFQAMMEVALVNDGPVSRLRCFFFASVDALFFSHVPTFRLSDTLVGRCLPVSDFLLVSLDSRKRWCAPRREAQLGC